MLRQANGGPQVAIRQEEKRGGKKGEEGRNEKTGKERSEQGRAAGEGEEQMVGGKEGQRGRIYKGKRGEGLSGSGGGTTGAQKEKDGTKCSASTLRHTYCRFRSQKNNILSRCGWIGWCVLHSPESPW